MLRFLDRACLYNLVNKANLVYNFSWYVFFFFSPHVSGDYVPIITKNNCINATLGTCHCVWMTVWYVGCTLHTRQSSTQNNKYQVSHWYSYFSWWWAHSRPKHVEKRNKHTKKNCAPSWLYLQDLHEDLHTFTWRSTYIFNPLNPELNPICYLLALLGAHHFLPVSRIRVKLLTFRLLMSYVYIWSTHSWCF